MNTTLIYSDIRMVKQQLVGPVGVGLLGCRTTEWKKEIVLGLLDVGLLAVGLKGCRTKKRRTSE